MKIRISGLTNRCMRFGRVAIALGALSGALLVTAALPDPTWAQASGLPTRNVSINLQNGDIRSALDALFKGSGLNYTIDPAVTGTITISLRDVPFDVALRSILRAANPPLTYSVQDGVYQIKPRNQYATGNPYGAQATNPQGTTETPPAGTTTSQAVRIPLMYADAAQLMNTALGGGVTIPPLTMSMGNGRGGMGMSGGMGGMGGMGGGMGMSGGMGGFGGGMSGGMGGFGGGMSGGMGGFGGGMSGGMGGGVY